MSIVTPENATKPGKHEMPIINADVRDRAITIDRLARHREKFTQVAGGLISSGILPATPFIVQRLATIPNVTINVTNNPRQEYHFFDSASGQIFLANTESELHTDHEFTHALLPSINWEALNEGVTQKVARVINREMGHPSHQHRSDPFVDFYVPNERLVDQIERITGLNYNNLLELASDRSTDVVEEINKRAVITVNGTPIGLLDYGKILEQEGYAIVSTYPYPESMRKFERDEFAVAHIVAGFSKIPSLSPVLV